jgi:alanyl-tRNA synthetase
MRAADIRQSFLRFFEDRGHSVQPSSSLVPANDPTLFFTNAGMVQFKDVFTGKDKRPYSRAATVQKCMRVSGKHNDLESVGFTARHHTLFEMLGNFSFGDYFKDDAIAFAWEFLTKTMSLPADRLLVSVFRDDDESFELWRKQGVPADRIARCGEKDNFWSMGPIGPCGPCTEIHWDLQEGYVLDREPDPWGFGHDAGRFLEIWNNVFMQFERYEDGGSIAQRPLPKPSVDTGMGLERLTAIVQGRRSNWEIDEFQSTIESIAPRAGTAYGRDPSVDTSLRVIADHARATAFLVGDGVMPSNEERGYVLRRIMRRAIRHGVKIGLHEPFMHVAAARVIDLMSATYPELRERQAFILKVTESEEDAFRTTLARGLAMIDEELAGLPSGGAIPGRSVFTLHDTFGFPPDLTQVIAVERGFTSDQAGYEACMEEQRARSRANWKGSGERGISDAHRALEERGSTTFTGYAGLEGDGAIVAILRDGVEVGRADPGDTIEIVTDTTPFYAESGGQVGDRGVIEWEGGRMRVEDTQKPAGTVFVHRGVVERGALAVGSRVRLRVDADARRDTMRNHTATHLLHAALRQVLGAHVQQKGSLVAPDRLRFDFSHFEALSETERGRIEDIVNTQILADTAARVQETSMAHAQKMGAMALFGEKYGERVRVVEIPGFSTELCGGTHCDATGQIGLFTIVSEGGIAAGVRRIDAVTGHGAIARLRAFDRERNELAARLKAPVDTVADRVGKLLDERKELQKQVEELKQKLVLGGGGGPSTVDAGGIKLLAKVIDGATGKDLRGHAEMLLSRLGSGVVVLGAHEGDKASLVVKVSDDLTSRVHAGQLVQKLAEQVGGKGGGKADFAQAGGRDAEKLATAIDSVRGYIEAAAS